MFNIFKSKNKPDTELPSVASWASGPQPPILYNAIQCTNCLDILESVYTHDYKVCSCGKVSVDGGKSYCRWGYEKSSDIHDLTITNNEVKSPDFAISASFVGSSTVFADIKFYVTAASDDGKLLSYRAYIDHGSRPRPEGSHSIVDIENWPRYERGIWDLVAGVLKTANL